MAAVVGSIQKAGDKPFFFREGAGGWLGLWQGFGVCVVVFGVAVA